MNCKYRSVAYKGCDGHSYIHCSAMKKDMITDECGCCCENPAHYCDFFEKAGEINKDVVFDMMLNLLNQLYDGVDIDEVTTCLNLDEYDDFSLKEVIDIANNFSNRR